MIDYHIKGPILAVVVYGDQSSRLAGDLDMLVRKEDVPSANDLLCSQGFQHQRHLLDLKLGDLWRYKDLVILLLRCDLVSAYMQTIPGPLWYLSNGDHHYPGRGQDWHCNSSLMTSFLQD